MIFLELTAEAWRDWARALHAGLDVAPPGSAALVADVFARAFADRPLFCDLIAHTPLNLERNVSPEAVRHYKLTSLGVVDEAAALVARVLPALTLKATGGQGQSNSRAQPEPEPDPDPARQ